MAGEIQAVVLAAGEGTRMKSSQPKVLHKLLGIPMIDYVIDSLKDMGIGRIGVVIGFKAEIVKKHLKKYDGLDFFIQEQRLGSAHALLAAGEYLDRYRILLVLCGDTPLIRADTLKDFVKFHKKQNNQVTVMTALVEDPFGYGRIIKGADGSVLKIVEEKDTSTEEKKVDEINSGIYCMRNEGLRKLLGLIRPDNVKEEYYLTDIVGLSVKSGGRVGAFMSGSNLEVMGINSQQQLKEAERIITAKKARKG